MLSTSVPLQVEHSTEAVASEDNGSISPLGPSECLTQQGHSFAKPMADVNMVLDGQGERSDMEDRPGPDGEETLSDEDQDMSDGGAALTMTLSHAAQLNAELDMLDAEVMGSENLVGLLMDNHYQTTMFDNLSFPASTYDPHNYSHDSDVYDEDLMDDGSAPGPADSFNNPVALSAVSQQLQHIQDGHIDFTLVADGQHGGFQDNMDDQSNLGLAEFLYNWATSSSREEDAKKRPRGPSLPAVEMQREMKNTGPMTQGDLRGESCDIQRINWAELGVSRLEARQMRRQTYKNYTTSRTPLQWHPRLNGARLSGDEDYFRFRKMDFGHPVHLSHFQLRNLISCASRDHVFYAGRSTVHHYSPTSNRGTLDPNFVAMDLTNPTVQPVYAFPGGGVQISTMTVAHDILVVGGFSGEYGLINLKAPRETKHTEGIITQNMNGITNHVQVYQSRNSSSPVVAFASNDMSMRLLDIATNKFIAEHEYKHAINCTAISPDKRLRVLVGDNQNIMICNSETGEVLQDLEGHRDYGFACDWADDGWTVATGNQDMQVKIWDARKWTSSQGIACPVATIAAEMAGVRKLKFSPLGSGKRVLVAAEPADFINIIDAETFSSKQTLSFFGEIGGVDFTNDGQDLFVANCDSMRGGIMEFERCNFAAEAIHGLDEHEDYAVGRHRTRREQSFDWKDSEEEIARHPRYRGTERHRTRRAAMLGTNMGVF